MLLTPLINSSKEYLLTFDDIDQKLLINDFDNNDPKLILASAIAISLERDKQLAMSSKFNYDNLFLPSVHATTMQFQGRTWDCVKSALGITAIRTFINSSIALAQAGTLSSQAAWSSAKLALHVVKHIGLRYLGAAVAVYSFGKCMDFWVSGGTSELNIRDCNNLVKVTTRDYTHIKYVYLSKKEIGYISDTEHNLNESTGYYDVYEISMNTTSSDCSVERTGRKITGRYLIASSVEGYTTHEIDKINPTKDSE